MIAAPSPSRWNTRARATNAKPPPARGVRRQGHAISRLRGTLQIELCSIQALRMFTSESLLIVLPLIVHALLVVALTPAPPLLPILLLLMWTLLADGSRMPSPVLPSFVYPSLA